MTSCSHSEPVSFSIEDEESGQQPRIRKLISQTLWLNSRWGPTGRKCYFYEFGFSRRKGHKDTVE